MRPGSGGSFGRGGDRRAASAPLQLPLGCGGRALGRAVGRRRRAMGGRATDRPAMGGQRESMWVKRRAAGWPAGGRPRGQAGGLSPACLMDEPRPVASGRMLGDGEPETLRQRAPSSGGRLEGGPGSKKGRGARVDGGNEKPHAAAAEAKLTEHVGANIRLNARVTTVWAIVVHGRLGERLGFPLTRPR